jgi:Fe-S-cluster containining protein
MTRFDPPFARTVCACSECRACCHEQPGHLIPGDFERIATHLGLEVRSAKRLFVASRGALVQSSLTGRTFRIGTITPAFDSLRRRCVFLDDEDRCTIHAVAPFGCTHFDTHMRAAEGQRRSVWGLRLIQQEQPDYDKLRSELKLSDRKARQP